LRPQDSMKDRDSPYSGKVFQRSAFFFLTGKIASSILTFLAFILVVRLLTVKDYGAYVTFIAAIELLIAISSVGLYWVSARYLPDYRIHASGAQVSHLTYVLLFVQIISLAIILLLLWFVIDECLHWSDLIEYRNSALLLLIVLFIEGIGRFIREALLGSLLFQGVAQIGLVTRNFVFLAFLFGLLFYDVTHLNYVVWAELLASIVGLVVSIFGLYFKLKGLSSNTNEIGWKEPSTSDFFRTGFHMYVSQMITLTYSTQIMLLIVQKYLGVEMAALFGFLRNLYEQVSRFLPATLFFSIVRPKLVASFVGGGGVSTLTKNSNAAGKLSYFFLMPMILISGLSGEYLISHLSSGKFHDSGYLLLGFMMVLIPFSQRQLLESTAIAIGRSGLCAAASASGVFSFPLVIIFVFSGMGLWSAILALGIGHILFNLIILYVLSRRDGFRADYVGLLKILGVTLVSYLSVLWLPSFEPEWLFYFLYCSVSISLFLFVSWLIKPFSRDERERFNKFTKLRVFIW